jgi:hypothetical protein
MRTNPITGVYSGYYRLVESYRNYCDRVCHRTILNAGYLDGLTTDELNLIQKILTTKVANHDKPLFELPYTDNSIVIRYVDEFYNRMVAEKRIDVFVEKNEKKASRNGKDLQMIDLNSIRNNDVREIGAEWLSYQAMGQLQIASFLESLGWREIVRTMNSQKAVTTLAQNNHEEVIMIRRCSEPNQQVRKLYDALKYKYAPFVKRKYVVHKSELENCQFIEKQEFRSD